MESVFFEWRVIPGYEAYEVSENGEVRRYRRGTSTFPGRPLKLQSSQNVYGQYHLYMHGQRHAVHPHVLVALAFLGPKPFEKAEVAHRDGDRHNNHYTNLRWATRIDNAADMSRHRRACTGEQQWGSKLTWNDALLIRQMARQKIFSQRGLAAQYGITQSSVSMILHGKTWIVPEETQTTAGSWQGEANGQAKLTGREVQAIRERYASGTITQARLAAEYQVSKQTINIIVRRKGWTHLSEDF
jgi:hypothetical protein